MNHAQAVSIVVIEDDDGHATLSAFSCKWSNCRRGSGSRRLEAVRKPFMTR
ncbi:hypothetical protein [Paraburkholderia tuberum]|uniref:Uncharacterized protein n=1 Tax=Paraburkholderia tuberum TaxID=157910 RepID=A0A1H1H6M8_9BURK|nr:hypothetical protein [Paraburkholderia tuberum]SDR20748.1 hypothetical protein SAMN05445850_3291 [Paraburkholderia tuberum]